jgi:hypothetical protein
MSKIVIVHIVDAFEDLECDLLRLWLRQLRRSGEVSLQITELAILHDNAQAPGPFIPAERFDKTSFILQRCY